MTKDAVFTRRVLSVVSRIPPGRVATYGDVAAAAGYERAARAVGTVMRTCGRPDLPCHRVIAAGGRLGGFGGQPGLKVALLRQDGVAVAGGRIRDFATRRWPGQRGISEGREASNAGALPALRRPSRDRVAVPEGSRRRGR